MEALNYHSSDLVVELTKALVNIDSTTGREGKVAEVLGGFMRAQGWNVHYQPLVNDPARKNLLITPHPFTLGQDSGPRVILCSHLDTVPPFIPPSLSQDELTLFGRGTNDAKGQVSAMICAAKELNSQGAEVGMLLVVGEEVDHIGAIEANNLGLKPELIVCGEPSESRLASGQKGILKIRISAKGKSGHSGYPEAGVSATHALINVLHSLSKTDWPSHSTLGQTTLNIGTLQGGEAGNVIAPSAEALCVFRLVTSPEEILPLIQTCAAQSPIVSFEVVSRSNPQCYDTVDIPELGAVPVAYNTDLPYLQLPSTTKRILFGPGSILCAHGPEEKISIPELREGVKWLTRIVQTFFA